MNSVNLHTPPSFGPRILIANEDTVEALRLENWLRNARLGHVRSTTDAREVEPLFDKWRFSVLLLDMHNTLIDGAVLMNRLAPSINAGDLRVVALINPDAEVRRTIATGATGATGREIGTGTEPGTLTRPIERTALIGCVQDVLKIQAPLFLNGPNRRAISRRPSSTR